MLQIPRDVPNYLCYKRGVLHWGGGLHTELNEKCLRVEDLTDSFRFKTQMKKDSNLKQGAYQSRTKIK